VGTLSGPAMNDREFTDMTHGLTRDSSVALGGAADSPSLPYQRMERLLDPGSLQLLRTRVKSRGLGERAHEGDGVLTGIGTVDGRPVGCYAQDARVAGGSLGEAQAEAIVRLLGIARDAGMPVVSFLESSGARVQEAVAALAGYARIFHEMVALSRFVPQISIVTGVCAGGSAYAPALSDFVIMTESAAMFLTGPRIVQAACGEDITVAELGGSRIHSANGVCQLVAADDIEAAAQACRLLSYLPQNARERTAPAVPWEQPACDPGALLPSRPSAAYDVREVIGALADRGDFLETDARWARNFVTGFARIGGHAVGVLANQPKFIGGVIDTHASEKAARFVELCDAYALALVVLVDTPGFMPGMRQEGRGIIHSGAGMVRAFAAARVPRFTVIMRKAYGGAYIAMNSMHLGATITYAWPDAEIGIMDARSAVTLIHRMTLTTASDPDEQLRSLASEYHREHCGALVAAHGGFVDEVIAPAQTRARLRSALATFDPRRAPPKAIALAALDELGDAREAVGVR
jgi:acetyl-CoA carboxylase carboxyltransferase component